MGLIFTNHCLAQLKILIDYQAIWQVVVNRSCSLVIGVVSFWSNYKDLCALLVDQKNNQPNQYRSAVGNQCGVFCCCSIVTEFENRNYGNSTVYNTLNGIQTLLHPTLRHITIISEWCGVWGLGFWDVWVYIFVVWALVLLCGQSEGAAKYESKCTGFQNISFVLVMSTAERVMKVSGQCMRWD